jgi:hypothetical protein
MKAAEALFQPLKGLAKADLLDMHDQIDGPTATPAQVPIHELGPIDRQHSPCGAPFGWVVRIGRRLQGRQDGGQGQSA